MLMCLLEQQRQVRNVPGTAVTPSSQGATVDAKLVQTMGQTRYLRLRLKSTGRNAKLDM